MSAASEEGGELPPRRPNAHSHLRSRGLFLSSPGPVSLYRRAAVVRPHSRAFLHCSAALAGLHSPLEGKHISVILEVKTCQPFRWTHHRLPSTPVPLLWAPGPGSSPCPPASRGSGCQGTPFCKPSLADTAASRPSGPWGFVLPSRVFSGDLLLYFWFGACLGHWFLAPSFLSYWLGWRSELLYSFGERMRANAWAPSQAGTISAGGRQVAHPNIK